MRTFLTRGTLRTVLTYTLLLALAFIMLLPLSDALRLAEAGQRRFPLPD